MNILCYGLSHRTAPVETRERFAVREAELAQAAAEMAALASVREAVIVSTCNRVEYYLATHDAAASLREISALLEQRSGPVAPDSFYCYDSPKSVRHLFRLVCGLDSMVVGETEVFGQVKKAYLAASAAGGTARHLNRLFQRAFNVGKEVRSHTNITRGSVSVASVAVDLAQKIFGKLSTCQVMILGAGETSEQTARHLLSRGARSVFVSNRSHDRAVALAAEMGGRALHFDEWHRDLTTVDILISSTSAPHFLLTREKLEPAIKERGGRPLFVIDLAVPRDVEPAVNDFEGVYLYDIDSLRTLADANRREREREAAGCETIVERHVGEFMRWLGEARPARLAAGALPAAPPLES